MANFYFTIQPKYVDPVRLKCAVQGCQNPGETCNYVVCSADLPGDVIPGLPQHVKLYLCDSCYALLRDGATLHNVSIGYKPEPVAVYTENGIEYLPKAHPVEYCRCMDCAKARANMEATA